MPKSFRKHTSSAQRGDSDTELQSLRESQNRIEAIDDSEARFRTVFENAAVGMARVATDGRFLEVNQRLCQILGYARDELLTKTFGEFTHPDDLVTDLNAMRRMLAGQTSSYAREKRYHRKDGSTVWCNLSVALLHKADGSPDYFISVVEDNSARRQAEQKLRESEERLRLASNAAGLGVFEWNVQTDNAIWENERMYEIFGHTRADGTLSKAQLIEHYVHPEDVATLELALDEGMMSRRPFKTVYRIRRRDGATRWLGLAGNFEYGAGDAPIRMIGVLGDITERQEAQEALRASEERFRILADTAPVLIWMSGSDKLCTFFNKPWLDFTGRLMEEELGNGWAQGVHPEDYDRCLAVYIKSFEAREPFEMDYRLRRYDGEYRWVLDHGLPRFSTDDRFLGYVGSCIDITERKQAEAQREELAREQVARAAAEAASRSKDEFLATVSHELRSPLTAIFGYTRILRSGLHGPADIGKAAAAIERSAKAQLQIIEDLLDSARIVAGKLRIEPSPIDMVSVLEAAVDTVRAAAEAKRVTLSANFSRLSEQVLGDSTRLQQIVWNLLANAIKFTPENGRVELTMESDAATVRIQVRDNGRGITAEFLPFVFDRFRQADSSSARRYGGLGLGLSLVKHIVELHGGTITAASEGVGRGATFTVSLPRRHAEFLVPQAVVPQKMRAKSIRMLDETLSLTGVSVLVVDDQEDARLVLTETLKEFGAQVTAVSSGLEALALLAHPPDGKRPDALVLDIALPDEDGYTVLKKVRAAEDEHVCKSDPIPAIALTAFGGNEERQRTLQAGFHMHLAKPVEPAKLAAVIASLKHIRTGERRQD